MKKRYSKPITECMEGSYTSSVLQIVAGSEEGTKKQVLDPDADPTEDDGRSNTVLWDTMDNTF